MAGYKFKCKDTGMKCDFEIKGASSKDEVMQEATVHAKMTHNMKTVPTEMERKVAAAVTS